VESSGRNISIIDQITLYLMYRQNFYKNEVTPCEQRKRMKLRRSPERTSFLN